MAALSMSDDPEPLSLAEADTSALAAAIEAINAGAFDQACPVLDRIIATLIASVPPGAPPPPAAAPALVARGTARALRRDLAAAIDDFTAAISAAPGYCDSWKRRGQARAAVGDYAAAIDDLAQAARLAPSPSDKADALAERAGAQRASLDLARAAADLERAVAADPTALRAWCELGQARTGLGALPGAVIAYERALDLNATSLDAWVGLLHAHKEAASSDAALSVFDKLSAAAAKALTPVPATARRLLTLLLLGLGRQAACVRACDALLTGPPAPPPGALRAETLYTRGLCLLTLGRFQDAATTLTECVATPLGDAPSEDARAASAGAFYLRSHAAWLSARLDVPVATFSYDADVEAEFKEAWCKKAPPTAAVAAAAPDARSAPPPPPPPRPLPPPPSADDLAALVRAGDAVGGLLQYRCQGFLPNARARRAAGLAALQYAQALLSLASARLAHCDVVVSAGASSPPAPHAFAWRDGADIVVKWRQLGEPGDQVVWVDTLTRAEFEAGFGSHTPIFTGQTSTARYGALTARAVALFRDCATSADAVVDAAGARVPLDPGTARTALGPRAASSPADLLAALGRDAFITVPVAAVKTGRVLDGTRLTVARGADKVPDGVDLSIRTPVTPARWAAYAAELAPHFDDLIDSVASRDAVRGGAAALALAYYWFNFMPLARGSAAVGFASLLGALLATGSPAASEPPPGVQIDWDAILARSPGEFEASVAPWLLRGGKSTLATAAAVDVEALPDVGTVLASTRARIAALNWPEPGP